MQHSISTQDAKATHRLVRRCVESYLPVKSATILAPNANIEAPDGSLWIAKFPSKNDECNIGAWEKVTHDLAKLCGLNVPESKLETFSKLGSTFLVKRFDRDGKK